MKKTWIDVVMGVLAGVGGYLATLVGGYDTMLQSLVVLVVLDVVFGVIRAIMQKKLNSEVSWKGGLKKLVIFGLVAVGVQVDKVMGTAPGIRAAVVLFYCASEGLSILENAVAIGLPVPQALKDALEKLNSKKFGE